MIAARSHIKLGTPVQIAYRRLVIGFLRFVGLMNAAVWFGAAVLFVFGVEPAATSEQMRALIGAANFPYYGEAIRSLEAVSYFRIYLTCSVIALIYLIAEWLYFGKYPPRRWLILVLSLILLGFIRGYWLEPALSKLHRLEYGRATPVEQREVAARAFRNWKMIARSIDVLLAVGLGFYVWRVANPAEPMRFVSAKFRS